jgi:hypothetical protein
MFYDGNIVEHWSQFLIEMPKFSESISTDYRSRYKEKNKRHSSKHSSFQPLFNSDEFYNPVYTESVTSIEQQLDIVANGNAQNATQALNSLSFLLSNPFQHLTKSDTVFLGICGDLLYFSKQMIQDAFNSQGWKIEFATKKNASLYTHLLVGIRPSEKEMEIISSLSVPLTVEYHCKRYFERNKLPFERTDFSEVILFIHEVIDIEENKTLDNVQEISSILFAFELFGASKVIRLKAREFLKECLSDAQKDTMRLHWFKQPSKYTYNPKFFADVSNFLETVQLNGVLFQETAFQLTTLPTTQELLASSQATAVLQSMLETTFRSEFFEKLTGVTLKNIDKLFLELHHFETLQNLEYLSLQLCDISSLTATTILEVRYLSLQDVTITEQDFCILLESFPNVTNLHLHYTTITPSKQSQLVRLKLPNYLHITISHLHYEFSNELYKKVTKIPTLLSLTLEDYSLNSSLHLVQFNRNQALEQLSILGIAIKDISALELPTKQLHTLTLRSTGIQSLQGIERIKPLKALHISDEILHDVAQIKKCANIESIVLRSCALEVFPEEILECSKLHTIDLTSNSFKSIILKGKKNSKLQRLLLSNNLLETIEISNFPFLEFLYLSKNEITTLPAFVTSVKNKQMNIDMVENPFTKEAREKALQLINKGWRILISNPYSETDYTIEDTKTIE